MKNQTTELVFILDKSGSMYGLEGDTIGGFNSMLEKQKLLEGKCLVSTVLFNHKTYVLHDRKSIDSIKPLTSYDYRPEGNTALLDALGGAIHHIGNIHKYARPEDVPENTLFVIITDGQENASKSYSSGSVKKMIQRQKEKYGWDFIFMGANIDAVETAGAYGISPDRAINYNATHLGTRAVYAAASDAVCCMRACSALDDTWRKSIEEENG